MLCFDKKGRFYLEKDVKKKMFFSKSGHYIKFVIDRILKKINNKKNLSSRELLQRQ